jgi:hypothetical protein
MKTFIQYAPFVIAKLLIHIKENKRIVMEIEDRKNKLFTQTIFLKITWVFSIEPIIIDPSDNSTLTFHDSV